jgi:hypothetical protein
MVLSSNEDVAAHRTGAMAFSQGQLPHIRAHLQAIPAKIWFFFLGLPRRLWRIANRKIL